MACLIGRRAGITHHYSRQWRAFLAAEPAPPPLSSSSAFVAESPASGTGGGGGSLGASTGTGGGGGGGHHGDSTGAGGEGRRCDTGGTGASTVVGSAFTSGIGASFLGLPFAVAAAKKALAEEPLTQEPLAEELLAALHGRVPGEVSGIDTMTVPGEVSGIDTLGVLYGKTATLPGVESPTFRESEVMPAVASSGPHFGGSASPSMRRTAARYIVSTIMWSAAAV